MLYAILRRAMSKSVVNLISLRLREARSKANLSRRAVIRALRRFGHDMTERTLQNYESGVTEPPASLLLALESIYGVQRGYFFGYESYQTGRSLVSP